MNAGRNEAIRTVESLFESPDTLSSSLLSGCKNYSRAEAIGDRRVRAIDWNAELECAAPVSSDIRYIGVRAHYVRMAGERPGANTISCRVVRVTRDVFHTIVSLAPVGTQQENDFSRIRMETSHACAEKLRRGDTISVEIKPNDVMLLKK
jgi:molybdate transport system ATP-binding protein